MGCHVNTPHRAGVAAEYIRRVKPDAVKVLSSGMDGQVIAAAKEVGALIIGRLYWDDQKLGAAYGDFTRRVVQWARENPDIGWLEGANEFAQSPGELERYAEHEIERMKALDAIGRKAVIGNFSCGQPDLAQWSRFRPALEYAAAHGHCLGLHSYSGPVMQWLAGGNQWNNGAYTLTDPCEGPGVEGWLTLRYRKALKQFKAWGIGHIKIAITESGIDDVQPRPGPQGKGWKSYIGTEYQNMAPFGDYADQLAWYGRRLTEDANIIAWVDFGFSQAGDWSTFDLSDSPAMRERVIAAMQAIPRGHPSTVPAPQPQPPTPPEQPMDAFSAILRRKLGNRFSDDRAIMPKHATAKYSPLNPAAYKGIAVHHSASARGTAPASIADYHVTHNGWAGVGYHIIIRQGVAHYVGDLATQRAHVAGRNHELAGVCITGDYTKEAPRTEDLDTLRLVIEALDELLGKQLPINGHGGWALAGHKTECPGALVGPAREIRTGGGAPTQPPQPQPVQWGKLTWYLEDMVRRMEAEGLTTEAALVKSTWLPEAIRHRDKPGG